MTTVFGEFLWSLQWIALWVLVDALLVAMLNAYYEGQRVARVEQRRRAR